MSGPARARAAVAVCAGAALVAAGAPAARAAGVSVRIQSVRVVTADTRRPAPAPYRRARAYAYVVRYRIAGDGMLRVRRRAVLRTPGGTVIARVQPPDSLDEAGAYFASSRIPIGRGDPRAVYELVYSIRVQRGRRADRATRVVRLRFI